MALATFVGSFNFSSFTIKVGTGSTECTVPSYIHMLIRNGIFD